MDSPPPNDNTGTRIPEFGSAAHMDWIRRRLSKNIEFRRQVVEAARRALLNRRSAA